MGRHSIQSADANVGGAAVPVAIGILMGCLVDETLGERDGGIQRAQCVLEQRQLGAAEPWRGFVMEPARNGGYGYVGNQSTAGMNRRLANLLDSRASQ